VSFLADPAAPDTSCVGALKPPSLGKRSVDDLNELGGGVFDVC
jgi:hypothetical protein